MIKCSAVFHDYNYKTQEQIQLEFINKIYIALEKINSNLEKIVEILNEQV
jgi:hypothetical protein